MNIKILSFIAIIIGLLLVFLASPPIIGNIPMLKDYSKDVIKYLVIIGIILIGVGIVITLSGAEGKKHSYHHKTKMGEEVPIFHNKEIVGYRITK